MAESATERHVSPEAIQIRESASQNGVGQPSTNRKPCIRYDAIFNIRPRPEHALPQQPLLHRVQYLCFPMQILPLPTRSIPI